jgi:hypothetical protein
MIICARVVRVVYVKLSSALLRVVHSLHVANVLYPVPGKNTVCGKCCVVQL